MKAKIKLFLFSKKNIVRRMSNKLLLSQTKLKWVKEKGKQKSAEGVSSSQSTSLQKGKVAKVMCLMMLNSDVW